jgi:hypothetical protein
VQRAEGRHLIHVGPVTRLAVMKTGAATEPLVEFPRHGDAAAGEAIEEALGLARLREPVRPELA